MFRFEYPLRLWWLVCVLVWIAIFIILQANKKKKLNNAIAKELQNTILPRLSFGKQRFKFILVMIAYVFLIFAFANPQIATSTGKTERKGCDIMICLDVSNSMLAEDLSPNRLERAKLSISQLINSLQDDRIGIVTFAGSAFTFLPLTNDYATAKMFTDIIDTKLISNQGTDIQSALTNCFKTFTQTKAKERSRTIILISDGEENQQQSESIAKEIAKNGITINCIGIGSLQGAKIPVRNNGTTAYKTDKQGNIVVTKLNENTLKSIAAAGNGVYVHANNTSIGLDSVIKSINKMEKTKYGQMQYSGFNTVFYLPAIIALLLLFAEFIIYSAKNKFINRKLFFGKE